MKTEEIIKAGTKLAMIYELGSMKNIEFIELENDSKVSELDNYVYELAVTYAQMYNVYPVNEESEEEEEGLHGYVFEDVGYYIEIYNADSHDGYSMTGTPKFEKF
jgi:hypothetical protein